MSQADETINDTGNAPAEQAGSINKQISRKFAFTVCLLVILAMCSFWLINHYGTQNILRQQADNLGSAMARQTATQLTELMLANDLISMNVVLGNLTQSASIAEVSVLNVDGAVLATATGPVQQPALLLPIPLELNTIDGEYSAAISLADSVAGYVRLRLDLSYIEATLVNNLLAVVGMTVLLLIVAALLTSTYFQYLVSFPSHLLAFALANIRKGKIETCPEPRADSELAATIKQYNATAEFLAQNTFLDKFSVRLPESEQRQPLDKLGHEDVTLLAIKLANFHYLASTLREHDLVTLLNKYYFFAGKVSQLYSGTISKCADGEVLINFGGLPLEEEQAFFAVCAGQLFLHLQGDLADLGHHQVAAKFRLAVHSGQALTGVYSPITESTNNLMGPTLDMAWLLCDHCPNNSLLLSLPSMELAGAGSRINAEEFALVGDQDKIMTYLTQEPMSEYKLLIERQAMQLVTLYSD